MRTGKHPLICVVCQGLFWGRSPSVRCPPCQSNLRDRRSKAWRATDEGRRRSNEATRQWRIAHPGAEKERKARQWARLKRLYRESPAYREKVLTAAWLYQRGIKMSDLADMPEGVFEAALLTRRLLKEARRVK